MKNIGKKGIMHQMSTILFFFFWENSRSSLWFNGRKL
jgi:hypothetical protein